MKKYFEKEDIDFFYAACSPLTRILVCSTFFPFCSPHLPVSLLPCQHVCFSVYAACHHVFTAHHRPWPAILNCTALPSPPSLCLFSSYLHHMPPSNYSNSSSLSTQSSIIIPKSSFANNHHHKPLHTKHISNQHIFNIFAFICFVYRKFWFCYFGSTSSGYSVFRILLSTLLILF